MVKDSGKKPKAERSFSTKWAKPVPRFKSNFCEHCRREKSDESAHRARQKLTLAYLQLQTGISNRTSKQVRFWRISFTGSVWCLCESLLSKNDVRTFRCSQNVSSAEW